MQGFIDLINDIGWFNSDGTGVGVVLIGVVIIIAGFVIMKHISR